MLKLLDVDAGYGQAGVLHGLTFGVDDGEVVVLLGRNGMGKSSTMRSIMGWEEPQVTAGSIEFDGRELRGASPHQVAAAGIGYVPQGRLVFRSLDVEEHLQVAGRSARRPGAAWTIDRVYELFPRLAERRTQRAATLSGGEQQMLVIGRALMTNPRLLLLDEPSEGLAPLIVRQVGATVEELRREGMSILVAEQDVRFAIGLADRVLVLERGRVVAEGSPQEIDGDDELKRRHLGVEAAQHQTYPTPPPVEAVDGAEDATSRSARLGVAPDRRIGRRDAPDRVPPKEVTSVRDLLGGQPWDRRLFSNGWRETSVGAHTIVEPATGAILGAVAVAGSAEVEQAAGAAMDAQRRWAETPIGARCEILLAAAELTRRHETELVDWLVREAGCARGQAKAEVLEATVHALTTAAGASAGSAGELLHMPRIGGVTIQRRVPRGIVGAITSFSEPLALAARAVGPALALGNAVLLKPDVRTAVSGGLALARLFEEAGLPHGLLHVLPGGATTAQAVVTDARVEGIAFAGSRRAGRHVAAVGGQNLTPTSLHLGGPNTMVVLDDADVDAASRTGAEAAFLHQGQRCTSVGRHLVHRSLARDYVDRLAGSAAGLRIGDPYLDPEVDVGPLIDVSHAAAVASFVDAAVASGAGHRAGGVRSGAFVPPTVLVEVTPSMQVSTREVLGPVASVTVFDTVDEAIGLANRGDPGSTAIVHSCSSSRALELGQRLRVQRVAVNGPAVDDEGPDLRVLTCSQRSIDRT